MTEWRPQDVGVAGRVAARVTLVLALLAILDLAVRDAVPTILGIGSALFVLLLGVLASRIDWHALEGRPRGVYLPYVWTTSGLVAWAVFVGAGGPEVFYRFLLVLPVAVIASAIGYPPKGQLAMYAMVLASLFAGRWWAGIPIGEPGLVLEVGGLGVVALAATLLADHLRQSRETSEQMRLSAERREELLRAVMSLAQLDPDEAARAAVRELRDLGFDAATVNDLDGDILRPRAFDGFPPGSPPQIVSKRSGVVGLAVEEERTIVVEDYRSHPRALERRDGVGAVVATPITHGDKQLGVLTAIRAIPGPISPVLIEVAETIAAQTGRALANARRFAAERMTVERLAELQELRGELLASVSSELRDPLTIVQAAAETLAARPDLLDEGDMLRRLNRQTDRLAGMIRDLLDFSRLQEGRFDLRFTAVDVGELVRGAAPDGVPLEVDTDAVAMCDARLVRRVVEQLTTGDDGRVERVRVFADRSTRPEKVVVEVARRESQPSGPRGTIGLSLTSEALAAHGAALETTTEAGRLHLRFSLPRAVVDATTGGDVG